ncbi:sensory transduction histidine kinase [Desulfurispirillum indicum S5]|uniref:Sensory transduction histidine kinase n=1 Tax=Desulfurispirillum indicum (strain ATCC BAA-1389 / DSM 22839 / S5) TaxID=653733 RepID=E6W6C9_DESIS|nr:hypothetical protein [Desulfurispirillum indicum]ADU66165.1 sensory transduction histidine kinase [Desulfurispirillum indicum S5]
MKNIDLHVQLFEFKNLKDCIKVIITANRGKYVISVIDEDSGNTLPEKLIRDDIDSAIEESVKIIKS